MPEQHKEKLSITNFPFFLFIDWKVGLKIIQKETPDDVCLGRVLFVSFSVYHNWIDIKGLTSMLVYHNWIDIKGLTSMLDVKPLISIQLW
jgi:hypothetical protein